MIIGNKFSGYSRDNRRLYHMGGGGGGQTTSTTNTSNIPEYARPYVETMMGATQRQLFQGNETPEGGFNITGFQPYKAYGGTYDQQGNQTSYDPSKAIAGFQPLQTQAQQGIAGMQLPGEYGRASQQAAYAGMGGMDVAGQANTQGFQNQVGGYMNPYMQQVLTPQLDELRRQYGITGTQQQSQATQAGAFGGSRGAIMAAENARNLGTAQNQAIGQAYDKSFSSAQQQYNQNLQNQLAGYGMMGQSANQLAGIGNQMLTGQQGIYNMQNAAGAQQQALEQQKINQAMTDYANAQQYPLMQLGTMSNMLRGLPMQASTTNQYAAAPSALTQGIGAAGAGASLYNAMKAEGGIIKSYAEGGIASVPRYDVGGEVASQLESMDIESLTKQAQESSSPTVRAMAKRILREKQMEQSAGQGMAGGGIIAFSKGETVDEEAAARAQMKSDREAVSGAARAVGDYAKDAAGKFTAAGADILSMIPRGLAGAVDSTAIRAARALGADVDYISPSLTPGDQSSDTMTPFYDRYIRSKEDKAPAPATPAAAPTAVRPSPRDDNFRRQPDPRMLGIKAATTEAAAPPAAGPAPAPRAAAPAVSGPAAAPAVSGPGVATPAETASPAGIMTAAPVAEDGTPQMPNFTGPNAAIQRAAWKAEQEANRSDADYLKQVKEGAPENAAAAEYRKQIMAERANSKDETERQRYMRAAQFFAKWGSTPGSTLAAGLSALEKTLPDMISDEQGFKKAKRELDKVMYDIDNATRLEELGNRKEARALKEKAADRALNLNHYLAQAQSAENTARIQQESSKYSSDAQIRIAELRERSAALDRSANRTNADENKKFGQFQSASQQEILVNNRIAAEENGKQHMGDVKLVNDAKLMKPTDMPEGYVDKISEAQKRIQAREKGWATQLETAKKNTELAYSRVSGEKPTASASADKPISKAEFDKLPSGARFTAPDGSIRTKP